MRGDVLKPAIPPVPHYPTNAAKIADLVVHVVGLVFALFGGGLLLGLSVGIGKITQVAAIAIYATGLLLMLAFSTAYNFADDRTRPLWRRLDHAGIFLMIAGTYTPFTTHNLTGAWAVGMTTLVWTVAGMGVVAKLVLPGLGSKIWVAVYVMLGWVILGALKPLIAGALYMSGVLFYVRKRLQFARAIWHGHVVAAAGAHWTAVLIGVVLTTGH
jgi:hemolysin III